MRAVYVDGITPLDDDAYCRLAVEVELDPDAYRAALDDSATAADVKATVEEAHARGVFGVPSFFVDDRMFWGNDRLVLVRHFARRDDRTYAP
jgi:2-hydroxychromene-2-carboxylate isomerase